MWCEDQVAWGEMHPPSRGPQQLEEGRRDPPLHFPREHDPADSWISDPGLQNHEGITGRFYSSSREHTASPQGWCGSWGLLRPHDEGARGLVRIHGMALSLWHLSILASGLPEGRKRELLLF